MTSSRSSDPLTKGASRAEIAAEARRLGFDHFGVAVASPSPPEVDHFRRWLQAGHHGAMSWIQKGSDQRLDPSLLLRDLRSILVCALRYDPRAESSTAPLRGDVARYARGADYHARVGAMAGSLSAFLRVRFDARAAEYVDTGPILERLWAARAGIGWIGKNALVLNRESGSYFFLAMVLTDLDLPADEPAMDQCGQCSLCIEACPTGAIVEPRVVDSRRCLSYHTIELRGEFPEGYREAAGNRLFGCDDCQTACPWNGSPGSFSEDDATLASHNPDPDLVDVLSMTLADYTETFRGSAMKRATYQGLRRNAAIALGNILRGGAAREESERAMAALKVASSDPDPSVAEAAQWARSLVRE